MYVHKKCRGQTEMPADVIREYLDNPFELGEEPDTYCSRCKDDVPWTKCEWTETGQNMYEYIDDVRAEMHIRGDDPRSGVVSYNWLLLVFGAGLGGGLGYGVGKGMKSVLLPTAAGVVVGLAAGAVYMVYQRGVEQKERDEWNRKLVARYYKRYPDRRPSKGKRPRPVDDYDDEE